MTDLDHNYITKGHYCKLGSSSKDSPTLLTHGEQYYQQSGQYMSPPCLQVSLLLHRCATSRHLIILSYRPLKVIGVFGMAPIFEIVPYLLQGKFWCLKQIPTSLDYHHSFANVYWHNQIHLQMFIGIINHQTGLYPCCQDSHITCQGRKGHIRVHCELICHN